MRVADTATDNIAMTTINTLRISYSIQQTDTYCVMAAIPLGEPKQHALGNDVEDHQRRARNRRMTGGERAHRVQDLGTLFMTNRRCDYARRAFG